MARRTGRLPSNYWRTYYGLIRLALGFWGLGVIGFRGLGVIGFRGLGGHRGYILLGDLLNGNYRSLGSIGLPLL